MGEGQAQVKFPPIPIDIILEHSRTSNPRRRHPRKFYPVGRRRRKKGISRILSDNLAKFQSR